MFDIRKTDDEMLEFYENERIAFPDAEYDYTFEKRYLVYHAPIKDKTVYMAVDMKTRISYGAGKLEKNGTYEEDGQQLLANVLRAVKKTGGVHFLRQVQEYPLDMIDVVFRALLPEYGFAVREGQIRLSKQMYRGLTEKQVSICEAEVGTGKSMAYLVAAYIARKNQQMHDRVNEPITIATSSIELQQSLMERDIPLLSQVLLDFGLIEMPITAVLRKGKEHYFCRFRYEEYFRNISQHMETRGEKAEYLVRTLFPNTALDLDQYNLSKFLKDAICVKEGCKQCVCKGDCRYLEFRRNAMDNNEELDFQVTNHNLYLMSCKQPYVLRRSSMVVIDEAHKLKEASHDVFEEDLGENDIPNFLIWSKARCAKKENLLFFTSCVE